MKPLISDSRPLISIRRVGRCLRQSRLFVNFRAFCGKTLPLKFHHSHTPSLRHSITGFAGLCLLTSVLWQGAASAETWIIDGKQTQVLKLEVTDPQAARNFGTNTVYYTTNAVARWIALPNGIALEVNSSTGWVRQVEYTED
jgi:hypothetical protein